MPKEWMSLPFGELYAEPSRNGLSVPKSQRGAGVPMVNMRELFAHDFISDQATELVPISSDTLHKWCLQDGDLLFGRRSLTLEGAGKCSIVVTPPRSMVFESSLIRVRLDYQRACPRFFFYLFRSQLGRNLIETIVEQVAVAGIRSSDLARLRVPVPPIEEQRQIANALGVFDDLIDSNHSLSRRAESLAAALASSSPERVPLADLASVAEVRQFRPDGLVDHFSIPAFDEGKLPERINGDSIKSGKLLLAEPTVLVSRLNPQTPRVWMVYPSDAPAAASTEFVPLTGAGSVAVEEVWAVCTADEFAMQMMTRVTGTTGSHQRVDKAAIPQLLVADVRALDRCERTAIISLVREANASLMGASEAADVRDELLPLLLSRQLRVEEVAA